MSTIVESLARERELLDYPKFHRPSLHQLYGATIRNFQSMYNKLTNSNEAWHTGELTITFTDSDEIDISTDPTFGKTLLITQLADDGSESAVEFNDIQNAFFQKGGNQRLGNSVWGGDWFYYQPGGDSIYKFSLFYDAAGALKAKVVPQPEANTQFKVRYSLGNWIAGLATDIAPILSQFHYLFEIRAALDQVDLCEWEGLDDVQNDAKRQRRAASLLNQENRYIPEFEIFIREMSHDGAIERNAWDG